MSDDKSHKLSIGGQFLRSLLVAFYFFLIIVGYYLLKPLSRTLYITYLGSANLPYVWLATILVLSLIIPVFHFKVKKFLPSQVIATLIVSFLILLIAFRVVFSTPTLFSAFAFYVLVDVYSVLLVESFWSLSNSTYRTKEGSRWYGIVASGGLLGGLVGGWGASYLIKGIQLSPFDLITFSLPIFISAYLFLVMLLKLDLVKNESSNQDSQDVKPKDLFKLLYKSPRIRLLTLLLCMAQLIEPLVEYQFMASVENQIVSLSDRTKYVSEVFGWISIFGLFVNLIVISLVHSTLGVVGGLLMQPVLIIAGSLIYLMNNSLQSSAILKTVDRGLAYSSGRASRELLFTELGIRVIFTAKAWIDVYGYRLFRIVGSFLVLAFTWWRGSSGATLIVVFITILFSIIWISSIFSLIKASDTKSS